ncbi:hypothetical protein E4634_00185 [Mangrovimicrobium sediminis]|uniref:Sulfatase-modifying factor enzyme-like domain-containing protein n=1 Tax=Mangrovimicrobium sediminis TaxID=2562682 RepID=A0A4Z0M916_9GAMM|nr:SUMF1/EgtB/PvdO family nonheme iron enzyme [Haliea sp. SAOS-164]TGD76009.1 hypothetical protein E4634_00185 [Haliea sp. SAOS-164]
MTSGVSRYRWPHEPDIFFFAEADDSSSPMRTPRIYMLATVAFILLATGVFIARSTQSPAAYLSNPGPMSKQLAAGEPWQDKLRDGSPGPRLVVVPAGSVNMSASNLGNSDARASGGILSRTVVLERPFAVGVTEVTVAEFRLYATRSGHDVAAGCWYHSAQQEWLLNETAHWTGPGYEQGDDSPVTCINWQDAVAYTRWLSEQTGAVYRLPSEAEFEYFSRAGESGSLPFGAKQEEELCEYVNGADQSTGLPYATPCSDGFPFAGPVGAFSPNAFGLYDTSGNLWEFTLDCWNATYAASWRSLFIGPPLDGREWRTGNCRRHVIRGGAFLSSAHNLRLDRREPGAGAMRLNRVGIRLVREL